MVGFTILCYVQVSIYATAVLIIIKLYIQQLVWINFSASVCLGKKATVSHNELQNDTQVHICANVTHELTPTWVTLTHCVEKQINQ